MERYSLFSIISQLKKRNGQVKNNKKKAKWQGLVQKCWSSYILSLSFLDIQKEHIRKK